MNQQNRGKRGSSGSRSGGFRSGGGGFGGGYGGGNRRGGFGRTPFNGPREMHNAICADCKQDCQVPFKPAEGKPVYCKECYSKHKKF